MCGGVGREMILGWFIVVGGLSHKILDVSLASGVFGVTHGHVFHGVV